MQNSWPNEPKSLTLASAILLRPGDGNTRAAAPADVGVEVT